MKEQIKVKAFDYKKEYKEFYLPPKKPSIVDVSEMNFLAVRGSGDPNEEDGEYKDAVGLLYAVAYTIKMSYKSGHEIDGYFSYVVPPLEGFWWQEGIKGVDYTDKSSFQWIALIRLPDFVSKEVFDWAIEEATKKKKQDFSKVEYFTYTEGLSVQCMHVGSFDDEPATVAVMDDFVREKGYEIDFCDTRYHHEIYLSDPRKCDISKMKTVVRHPIKKADIIVLREEQPEDYRIVEEVIREAFWNHYVPGCAEHFIAHNLRGSEAFVKELDLVAVVDDKIVGNIMYSHAEVLCDDGQKVPVLCFGPVSVLPEFQGKGIGSMLIEETKNLAAKAGHKAIIICGDPEYYSRFGFVPAEDFDVAMEGNLYAAALQVLDLTGGKLPKLHGTFKEAKEFAAEEKDVETFDQSFPLKGKKSGLPSQKRFAYLLEQIKERK